MSEVFGYEHLGLTPISDRWLEVYYGPIRLGWLDRRQRKFSRRKPHTLKK